MADAIYYPEVRCEVIPGGLLPDGVTAKLRDAEGRTQFVQITPALINTHGDSSYLAVGVVDIDRKGRRALVELPNEADSGVNRMWVRFEELRHESAADAEAIA